MSSQRFPIRTAVLLVALSALLAACGSSSSSSSSRSATTSGSSSAQAAPLSGHASVAITNYSYHPGAITVAVGTKLTFTNHDQTAHTATSNQPAFDTGTVSPGHSATVTLKKPGSYSFYCQFHAFMHGTVVVK